MLFVAITSLLEVVEIPETPALTSNELLTSEVNLGSDFSPVKEMRLLWSLLTRWKVAHKTKIATPAVLKYGSDLNMAVLRSQLENKADFKNI